MIFPLFGTKYNMYYGMNQQFERKCPSCGDSVYYTTKSNRNRMAKLAVVCRKCDNKLKSIRYSSTGNPFFGKKHSSNFKSQLSQERKGKHFSRETEFKKGQKSLNKTPPYDIWLKKYGQIIADKKLIELKHKQSINSRGNKNSMYGKPPPIGSGNWVVWMV